MKYSPYYTGVNSNPDILSALTVSPFQAHQIEPDKYTATIFRVTIRMDVIQHQCQKDRGIFQLLADIRLPLGLGQRQTVTKYVYDAIADDRTSIQLQLSIDLTNMLMRVYASFLRNRIDTYLNTICNQIQKAAQMLAAEDVSVPSLLDDRQRSRVDKFRKTIRPPKPSRQTRFHGVLRVASAPNLLLVSAEAKMPDQQMKCANHNVTLDAVAYDFLRAGNSLLGKINNPALAERGERSASGNGVEFRQAAFEFGHNFYEKICTGPLSKILPIIVCQGQDAVLRLSLDSQAEELPWEALHDGQEFLSLQVRFSRCLGTMHSAEPSPDAWESTGILIVGSDSHGDLPCAEAEAKNIGSFLLKAGVQKTEVLVGSEASRSAVMRALHSGQFGILHFSGHSLFDPKFPYQSFLELGLGSRFYLHELAALARSAANSVPLDLVFLNSCQGARVGQDPVTGRHLSMCRTLREAGVGTVIGMQWNVGDEAAVQVGSTFYSMLMANPELGPEEAMRQTRNTVAMNRAWGDGSWLAPVLYT